MGCNQVNESNFDVETKDGVVIVDFFATWCGPCRALAPALEQVKNAKVVKVDIDQDPGLAVKYNVNAVPKLVFFKNGNVVDEVTGLLPPGKIQERVDQLNAW